MSYPVAGDPVYCTLANTYTLGSSLIAIGTNHPTGLVKNDLVWTLTSGAKWRVYKLHTDGTLTTGADFTLPTSANGYSSPNGPTVFPGTTDLSLIQHTYADSGGTRTLTLQKYTVNATTAAISLQDTHVFTQPTTKAWTPFLNALSNVVYNLEDTASGDTTHDFITIPVSDTGFGTRHTVTVTEPGGWSGFAGGFNYVISGTGYQTNRMLNLQINPTTGAIISNLTSAPMTEDDFYFEQSGAVANRWVFSGSGDPLYPDILAEVSDAGVVTATHPLADLIQDPDGKFAGEVWTYFNMWSNGGVPWLSFYNADNAVAALVKDPLGAGHATYYIHTDVDPAVTAIGHLSDGRIVTWYDDAPTGVYLRSWSVPLIPTPTTGISSGSEALGMIGAGSDGGGVGGRGSKRHRRTPVATSGLNYLGVEVSYGSRWVNINDGDVYKIGAESRDSTAKTWRKVTADSPILGGNYLIHAVPEMVSEQLSIWVYGQDQTDLSDNLFGLTELFEQYDFRIRWTFDEYREYWRCQLADTTMSRGQVWTHSLMAKTEIVVPRYPDVTRERI